MENDALELKHSGLAIASFATSTVSGVAIFATIVVAGVMEASTPGGMDEKAVGTIIIGLLIFLFLGCALVALGLGIAGLFQRNRKKVFAILGITFSAMEVLVTAVIMLLGASIE
jgi:Na+-driven multidrug efflux pump